MVQNRKKIRVAVLFGGESAEHEVSIQSARNVIQALDRKKYDVKLIGIDKAGSWHSLQTNTILAAGGVVLNKINQNSKELSVHVGVDQLLNVNNQNEPPFDVVFPVLHGPKGEDGTIQGLLELAKIPYVGSGVLSSALCMDKDIMKRLLLQAGLNTARYVMYRAHERKQISFSGVTEELGLPIFVKPANLGSSVGISKVHSQKEFTQALDLAFTYDNKIIIEEYIKGQEIECAVLGNKNPRASICGEIVPTHEFYSYEAKYLDENGAQLLIPARINKEVEKEVQHLAIKAFTLFNCLGMARVDFFVNNKDRVYVNELNTIPGFTAISMYPKLWKKSGVSYKKLINTLIDLAFEQYTTEERLLTSYTISNEPKTK